MTLNITTTPGEWGLPYLGLLGMISYVSIVPYAMSWSDLFLTARARSNGVFLSKPPPTGLPNRTRDSSRVLCGKFETYDNFCLKNDWFFKKSTQLDRCRYLIQSFYLSFRFQTRCKSRIAVGARSVTLTPVGGHRIFDFFLKINFKIFFQGLPVLYYTYR